MITVKIENVYECGRRSSSTVILETPVALTDQWWEDNVYDHTGDGHTCGVNEDAGYFATIVAPDRPELDGKKFEWGT